ncbi:M48 family metallopeptidase [uncultured Methanobrevibacter sp.]|uniref:M48 family metallopeptidase n=1 Tax=uncultured Methanobrevibacter sp. TaxID=253161 RepID=UPI0025FBED8C|nr:M48 family metallopeptidase [uncultured Methanobrevibacter sp.]
MRKDDRSPINPFTGKEHYDTVDDDKFLEEMFGYYYQELSKYPILNDSPAGQLTIQVATRLIRTVEEFLYKIGRYDYVDGYYEWEVHLIGNNNINATCHAGGKITVYSGILSIANTEERLAFILAHEMAHALLDHSRTKISARKTKEGVASAAWLGSFALDLVGLGEFGGMARAATNIANVGSEYFLMQPWGRDQEYEADKLGMMIAHLAGYDISHVPKFWMEFVGDNARGFDFFSTHPADDKRIAVMIETEEEIINTTDFYSRPILSETPKPKDEYNPYVETENTNQSSQNAGGVLNNPNGGLGGIFSQTSMETVPQASAFTSSQRAQNNSGNISTGFIPPKNYRTCLNCHRQVDYNDKFCVSCGFNLEKLLCPSCGGAVNDGDAFCSNCGAKLINELKCSSCGSKVEKGDKFCSVCGNKLN